MESVTHDKVTFKYNDKILKIILNNGTFSCYLFSTIIFWRYYTDGPDKRFHFDSGENSCTITTVDQELVKFLDDLLTVRTQNN